MSRPIPGLGVGILSWRGHERLARMLPTLIKGGLLDLAAETLLFLPEPEARTVALGRAHGLRVETAPRNLGILGGHKGVADRLSTPLVLLLEDDCPLIAPPKEVEAQLGVAADAIRSGQVDVFRLRDRLFPGMGARYSIVPKFHRYWPPDDAPPALRAAAAARRLLRPLKARRVLGTSLYEQADPHADPYALAEGDIPPPPPPRRQSPPEALAPGLITLMAEGYYRVSPKVIPWSNQSILICRDLFLGRIIPFAEAHPGRRGVNGFPDIERELNRTRFWERSGWHVGVGRGLFSHELPTKSAEKDRP